MSTDAYEFVTLGVFSSITGMGLCRSAVTAEVTIDLAKFWAEVDRRLPKSKR